MYIMWHEFGTPLSGNEWIPQIEKWGEQDPTRDFLATVFLLFGCITVLVYFLKGLNFTFLSGHLTREEYAQTPFGNLRWNLGSVFRISSYGSKSDPNRSSIENIKRYRDSKFSNMSNDQKAEEYKKTSWLDGLSSNDSHQASKAKDYINSKLSSMDNEAGYKWLKNEK